MLHALDCSARSMAAMRLERVAPGRSALASGLKAPPPASIELAPGLRHRVHVRPIKPTVHLTHGPRARSVNAQSRRLATAAGAGARPGPRRAGGPPAAMQATHVSVKWGTVAAKELSSVRRKQRELHARGIASVRKSDVCLQAQVLGCIPRLPGAHAAKSSAAIKHSTTGEQQPARIATGMLKARAAAVKRHAPAARGTAAVQH